ncbi:rRNA maturation RNase YbeY [Facilibium subflavum]|uniref:rRNA maturation RNase YbeY n=1 Tax=Facilibium subflavum TaxID=2219058 RepID=UPI000E657DCC|nr:rRNA maturation RNase YbeY [Facilibium subflavum]
MNIEIDLYNPHNLVIPEKSDFENWIALVLQLQGESTCQISINIATEDEIQAINNTYRHKDKPTNILSFPFEAPPGLPKTQMQHFVGDLIICPEILLKEAETQKKPLQHHWCHITIHGILHLFGYDHIKEDDAEIMENIEIKLLAQLNIDNPYVEK